MLPFLFDKFPWDRAKIPKKKGQLNMKKKLLDYDLQMFAEDESTGENEDVTTAESQEVAEESEADAEENAEEEGDAQPVQQSAEENARYAAIRRKAEEDARRKYEAQANADNERIALLCNGVKNPVTGQPITNMAEYLDALELQQKNEREQTFRDKGIDPEMVNQMIEANPLVRQAKQVIEKSKQTEAELQMQRDIAEISKIDPSIKGLEDIANLPCKDEILERVQNGQSLFDAYRLASFDSILKNQSVKDRQAAINEARGKSHLTTPSGVAQTDDSVDVPMDILNRWKSEGKSEKQIKELYNTVIKKLGGK